MQKEINMDIRIERLADTLINYSCKLKKGEKVLINFYGSDCEALVKQLIKEAYKIGAIPYVAQYSAKVEREILIGATEEQIKDMARYDALRMKDMDAYIGFRANSNAYEMADVPYEKMNLYNRIYMQEVHYNIRINKTKWVVLRFPTDAMAQMASQSFEAFEDFYYDVCNLDYKKMSDAMDPLKALMERTDKVHIKGVGTDLTFSIKNIPAIKCDGEMNIPDGEIYTAPVKDSVNGTLSYTCPSLYEGFTFDNVKLTFKDGKIIEATSNNDERINKIFNTDEGARYIGEFAIGVNPYILNPMKNILFDEKIMGSFHFTPGNAYDDAFNGNRSSIHWDLVCIQTPEYGGGEIYFDDVLIRKDGRFVIAELAVLNPENLK
jgi:aminopeptidase